MSHHLKKILQKCFKKHIGKLLNISKPVSLRKQSRLLSHTYS